MACSQPPPAKTSPPQDRVTVAIVAAEPTATGTKLVAIDEAGDRQFDLLTSSTARELNPAVSPDGSMMVFSSTRGGPPSVWLAKLGVEVAPIRLTEGAIEGNPVWTPDGKAIVFASTRDGGDYDLWRMMIETRALEQLTRGEEHEVQPAIARDGTIVYAAIDRATNASHLEARAPDGTITKLTPGPDEREPALSPDDKTIVFVSSVVRDGRKDVELWRMAMGGKQAKQLVDLPLTDERWPAWSRDGKFLFATSLLPGDPDPLFASVIFVEIDESPPHVRLLRDSVGAIARVTPAIATHALDAAQLRRDPEYLPELANIMARAIANQQQKQAP